MLIILHQTETWDTFNNSLLPTISLRGSTSNQMTKRLFPSESVTDLNAEVSNNIGFDLHICKNLQQKQT